MTPASNFSAGFITLVASIAISLVGRSPAAAPSAVASPSYPTSRSTYELDAYHVPKIGWVIRLENLHEVMKPVAGHPGVEESTLSGIMVNDTGYDASGLVGELTTQLAWSLGRIDGVFHGRMESYLIHFDNDTYQVWGPEKIAYEDGPYASREDRDKYDIFRDSPIFQRLAHKYVFFPFAISQIRYVVEATPDNLRIFAGDSPNGYLLSPSEMEGLSIRGDSPQVEAALIRIAGALAIPVVVKDASDTAWVRDYFEPEDRFAYSQSSAKGHVLLGGQYPGSEVQIYLDGIKTQDYTPVVAHGSCASPGASVDAKFSSMEQQYGSPRWSSTIPTRVVDLVDHNYAVLIRRNTDSQVVACADLTNDNKVDWDDE